MCRSGATGQSHRVLTAQAYQAGVRPVRSDREAAMLQVRIAVGLSLAALLAPAASVASQEKTASVIGQLVGRVTRAPIEGATVVLVSTGAVATSDSAGRFRYAGLSPGEHRLEVRAIGYAKGAWTVRLLAGEQQREFELDALTYELPGVVVEARGALGDFERRRAGGGGAGFFFTRADVVGRHARTLGDLMRGVSGVQTSCSRGSCAIVMSRASRGCRPEYYLDGFPASFSVGPDFPITGIYGIEVYRTASEVPAEFRRPELRCGVILIWSDMGR
jgi:carboxypeptidase family protein/TonB-dependent receptor-like protein